MWVLAMLPRSLASLRLSHRLLDLHRYLLCVRGDAFLNRIVVALLCWIGRYFQLWGDGAYPGFLSALWPPCGFWGSRPCAQQRPCADLGALSRLFVVIATFRTLPRTPRGPLRGG